MKLRFISSYQGIAHYGLISKATLNESVRCEIVHSTGEIKFQDYSKRLSDFDKKQAFRVYLKMQRLDRKELLNRLHDEDKSYDRNIVVDVFTDSIKYSQRIFRTNKNLH